MKKSKRCIFIQDWGTYPQDTLVTVGATIEEIEGFVTKHGGKKFKEVFKAGKEDIIENIDSKPLGFVWAKDAYTILWFDKFEDNWHFYETLMHETLHCIQFGLIAHRGMAEEDEAQAYQFEYLFRNIRRRLYEYYKGKK